MIDDPFHYVIELPQTFLRVPQKLKQKKIITKKYEEDEGKNLFLPVTATDFLGGKKYKHEIYLSKLNFDRVNYIPFRKTERALKTKNI